MKKIILLGAVIMALPLFAQDSLAVNKLGRLTYAQDLNDVWGYADSNGDEYALVGVRNGFSVVDISNPSNPTEVMFEPGAFSVWRDMKTWSHYAYVVHDNFSPSTTSDGILIVDMDSVNQPTPKLKRFYPSITVNGFTFNFNRAHNIYIDENGILYVFGSNVSAGGALMFDLKPDPENPVYLGVFNANYLHDGMVRGDTLWGGAINDDRLQVIDVSDKTNPVILGSVITPGAFTHNCWVSDNNQTVYTTDEISGAFVTAYDVSDPTNIKELDRIKSSYGGPDVIPHNVHVLGDFLVTSFYTSGLQIVDATMPDILIETAYYDTSPLNGTGYNGAWGAYPYLPSGNILITDIQQGLFVLSSTYPKGCYLTGLVKDSLTQNPIPNAQIRILNLNQNFTGDVLGKFKAGIINAGFYPVVVSKSGYITDTVDVFMNNGIETHVEIALLQNNISLAENSLRNTVEIAPNPSSHYFEIDFGSAEVKDGQLQVLDMRGSVVMEKAIHVLEGKIRIEHRLPQGAYMLQILSSNSFFEPSQLIIRN